VTTDRERDATTDRLLRAALRPGTATAPDPCPSADDLAAFAQPSLPGREREVLERHIAACERCQQTLVVLADMSRVEAGAEPRTAGAPWWLPLRWLVPAAAAAVALILYVAVWTNPGGGRPATSPAAVPSQATAQSADRSITPTQPAAPPPAASASPKKLSRDQQASGGGPAATANRIETPKLLARGAPSPAKITAREQAPPAAARPGGRAVTPPVPPQFMAESIVVARPPVAGEAGAARGAARGEAVAVPLIAPPPLVTADQMGSRKAAAAAPPAPPSTAAQTRAVSAIVGAATRAQETVLAPAGPITPVIRSADGTTTWRLGPGGVIASSRDGGATWQPQTTGASADLLAGSAPIRTICWVVGRSGTVLLTTDGERWQVRPFPEHVDLAAVAARDERIATVITNNGRRFTTMDGGATWTPARQ
jgi:hypothetical protein